MCFVGFKRIFTFCNYRKHQISVQLRGCYFCAKNCRYPNKQISISLLTVAQRHLRYLNEWLVSLAFFAKEMDFETKEKRVASIKSKPLDTFENIALVSYDQVKTVDLCYFVSERSFEFFEKMKLNVDFLNDCPKTWETNFQYFENREKLKMLRVVNDVAERGVALSQRL